VRAFLALVAGAFVLRLNYALFLAPSPPAFGDSQFFHDNALRIADGLGYTEGFFVLRPTAAHPPLFPLGLAAIAWLGGRSVDAQRLLGVVAGSGTVLVVGLIAWRLAGRRAALVAAALTAVYPAFVAADASLMSESVFGLLVACSLLQALRLLEAPSPLAMAVLGALIGAAALTRPEGLLLVPPALALALLAVPRRQLILRGGALVAATLLLVGPWIARNHHVFGRVVYTTNEGTTLAGANCHRTYYGDLIGSFAEDCLPPVQPGVNPAVANEDRRRTALRYIRDHSGRAVVIAGLRVLRTWGFYGIDSQTTIEGRNVGVQTAGTVYYYPLLALGLAGAAVLYAWRQRAQLAIMLAPICVSTLTAALTYGLTRLRHISDIALLALAGVAITAALRGRSSANARAHSRAGSPAGRRA
jgi:Gpi18-like mannosyltransferase